MSLFNPKPTTTRKQVAARCTSCNRGLMSLVPGKKGMFKCGNAKCGKTIRKTRLS